MTKYLIVLLDKKATSFCYYNSPENNDSGYISFELLTQIVDYANKNGFHINFLFSNNKIPKRYETFINSLEHTKIVPLGLVANYKNSVKVINPENLGQINTLKNNIIQNIILRFEKSQLSKLSEIIKSLLPKCKRLNLMLLDIQDYKQPDYAIYSQQLSIVEDHIIKLYRANQPVELNFISDRILLSEMNNCNAGITHFTFAPNGKFYICPAFYYSNPEDSIGDLTSGIHIKNANLLELEYAPICRSCDAYHCKRCVYLNKLTTLEINTPSQQQCTLSHLERGISKNVLELLKTEIAEFQNLHDIPSLSYLDPFELVKHKNPIIQFETNDNKQPQNLLIERSIQFQDMTDREILFSIYEMQKEILNRLKKIKN